MTIEQRVAQLESDLAKAKRMSVSMTVVIFALVMVMLARSLHSVSNADEPYVRATRSADGSLVIRAGKFVVQDKAGHLRGAFGMLDSGPTMSLLDAKGNPRATLSVTKQYTSMSLFDEQGHGGGAMCAVSESGPMFDLIDPSGKTLWSAPPIGKSH